MDYFSDRVNVRRIQTIYTARKQSRNQPRAGMHLCKKPLSSAKQKLSKVVSYTHFMHCWVLVQRLAISLFQQGQIAEKASK